MICIKDKTAVLRVESLVAAQGSNMLGHAAKILVINGSYRDDGVTDQVVEAAVQALRTAGAEFEIVLLREHPIEFCLNCRECTQQPGHAPGSVYCLTGCSH